MVPELAPLPGCLRQEIEAAVVDQLRAVFRQPEIIVGSWKAANKEDPAIVEADARAALLQLDPLWDGLVPAEQARIVQLLVERVDQDAGPRFPLATDLGKRHLRDNYRARRR